MRGFLGLIFFIAMLATVFGAFDVLTVENRANATVFQQIVARVSFGISALVW